MFIYWRVLSYFGYQTFFSITICYRINNWKGKTALNDLLALCKLRILFSSWFLNAHLLVFGRVFRKGRWKAQHEDMTKESAKEGWKVFICFFNGIIAVSSLVTKERTAISENEIEGLKNEKNRKDDLKVAVAEKEFIKSVRTELKKNNKKTVQNFNHFFVVFTSSTVTEINI